jgi:hypothetical protein
MKRLFIIAFFAWALSLPAASLYAASLRLLSENPGLYDLQEVEVVGEVLDELPQKRGSWLNLSDGTASVGVWAKKGLRLPAILHFGSYRTKGDTLRVKGVFHASCDEHVGQMDIHAQQVTIIGSGVVREERVADQKKRLALGWLIFSLAALIIYLIKRSLKRAKARKK